MAVDLVISAEMKAKLAAAGATPLLDSQFVPLQNGGAAEKVLTDKGVFLSSPANDWALEGPFGLAE